MATGRNVQTDPPEQAKRPLSNELFHPEGCSNHSGEVVVSNLSMKTTSASSVQLARGQLRLYRPCLSHPA